MLFLLCWWTNDLHGAVLQVDLDMVGMRHGRWGIGNTESFATLKLPFPIALVFYGRFGQLLS